MIVKNSLARFTVLDEGRMEKCVSEEWILGERFGVGFDLINLCLVGWFKHGSKKTDGFIH